MRVFFKYHSELALCWFSLDTRQSVTPQKGPSVNSVGPVLASAPRKLRLLANLKEQKGGQTSNSLLVSP